MKHELYTKASIKICLVVLMNLVLTNANSQNAVLSTPLGIGKKCGTSKDSFRVLRYDDITNTITAGNQCKPNLGGGSPSGPPFSSTSGSIAFNPQDQKVYYIATTTGNESFVYSWTPNACPTTKQVYDYYYPTQFVVGLDFNPLSTNGDGYQLEFTGTSAPYTCYLRKVNFATNTFGASIPISLTGGKKIYQQRGDIIFTPQGELYFAFDDKLFHVDFSNYESGSVIGNYIDTLVFPSGYHLTGISYANGKFIGSIQNSGTGCAFKEIDVSSGSAVISSVTISNGNFAAIDMATLINGIGVAEKVSSVTPLGNYKWSVEYDVKIKNFGNSVLNNVQLVEDLSAVFGALFSSVSISSVGTLPPGLTLNPSFNGSTDKNIFVGGASSVLNTSPADSATVRISLVVTNPDLNVTYLSSSIGSATDKMFGFTVSDSSNGDNSLRIDLNSNGVPDDINEDIPTPLRFSDWTALANNVIDFNGSFFDGKVGLRWNVQNAQPGLVVNVQRTSDGRNFQTVQSLPTRPSSSQEKYAWTDSSPVIGKDNIYRLEFVRQNGTIFYSGNVLIRTKDRSKEFLVSPNPFNDHISFSISFDKAQKLTYKLLSLNSGIMAVGQKFAQIGKNSFTIDKVDNLPAGTYLLQILAGDDTYHKVIIKAP